jgi:hypothetical protein
MRGWSLAPWSVVEPKPPSFLRYFWTDTNVCHVIILLFRREHFEWLLVENVNDVHELPPRMGLSVVGCRNILARGYSAEKEGFEHVLFR